MSVAPASFAIAATHEVEATTFGPSSTAGAVVSGAIVVSLALSEPPQPANSSEATNATLANRFVFFLISVSFL
jgi:hypothetical protein